ncbi:sensor histidine kinase [Streptomyces tsukubensis]|uniref:histidine kinase n=1 Tax=Streptomyces tsukubensis TaxID=83656 RepID=A0A1V4A0X1_9ACTN|nr:histidine kinase [Streptomyces tsukubensis]OON71997.1 two-component sensor histidine kinase [Streptomyces tsukubensis]QFR95745.1 two-component sensor histidine kinase [Streptomyces tsukubensis]
MAVRLPRPPRDDVLIAVGGLLGGLLVWAVGLEFQGGRYLGGAWVLVPLTVTAVAELGRRTLPRTAALVGTVMLIADQFTQGSLATYVMFSDLMYAVTLYGSAATARRMPALTGLVSVMSALGFLAWLRDAQGLLLGALIALLSFAPACTAVMLRDHREEAVTARLRAEQTALLAEMDRAQAVAAERARMARELHDMVAGHLSAIAIHSTAALSLDDPGTSREALGVIRENSVDGLAEMRRLIGLLRDPAADQHPAAVPRLEELGALVAHAAEAGGGADGLTFTLADSRPSGDVLPTPVELAAYRIVQESLTNSLKHASPGPVTVTLARGARALTIRVTSVHGDVRTGPRAPGSGAGLIGMRERVELLGGTFEAGPVPGAGQGRPVPGAGQGRPVRGPGQGGAPALWRVLATLPVEGSPRPAPEGDHR